MVDELIENKINEDTGAAGYTTFGGPGQGMTYAYPRGRIGKFFARFFATPALPYLVKPEGMDGDVIINPDRPIGPARMTVNHQRLPFLPEIEINRNKPWIN